MPEVLVCLAARALVRDGESNAYSVFSIFEGLKPQGFPAIVPEVGVLLMLRRLDGDPNSIDLTFAASNNATVLHRTAINLVFDGKPFARSTVTIGGLVIREPGVLRFSFARADSGAEVASFTVLVDP